MKGMKRTDLYPEKPLPSRDSFHLVMQQISFEKEKKMIKGGIVIDDILDDIPNIMLKMILSQYKFLMTMRKKGFESFV